MKNAGLIALLAVTLGIGAVGVACGGAPTTPAMPSAGDMDAGAMPSTPSTASTPDTSMPAAGGDAG